MEINDFRQKLTQAIARLEDDLKKVRTGRAHPDMLDSVRVEAYGVLTPLNQVANVTVPEPQLLQITPFDPANIQQSQHDDGHRIDLRLDDRAGGCNRWHLTGAYPCDRTRARCRVGFTY